jgi:hypothetical protein
MAFYSQYLNIQDSNATPSNTFFVDGTSVNNGNNTGWVFVNGLFVFAGGTQATAAVGTPSVTGDANVNVYNNLQFLDVQDCIAAGANLPFYVSGAVDSGNNVDWVLNPDAIPGLILATGFVGTVDFSTNNNIDVTGLEATSALGSVTLNTNNNIDVTGLSATGSVGSVTISGIGNVYPAGLEAVSALGLVDTQTDNYIDVTGLQGTTALGTVDPTAAAVIIIPSQSSPLLFLDIQDCIAAGPSLPFIARASVDSGDNVNWDINPMVPLVPMIGELGIVVVAGKGNITVTGLQANAQLGFGLVWGLINDAQNPNWVDIPT